MTRDILFRSVDEPTSAILHRFASMHKATYAQVLTLALGEYAEHHAAELVAWARGDEAT